MRLTGNIGENKKYSFCFDLRSLWKVSWRTMRKSIDNNSYKCRKETGC